MLRLSLAFFSPLRRDVGEARLMHDTLDTHSIVHQRKTTFAGKSVGKEIMLRDVYLYFVKYIVIW